MAQQNKSSFTIFHSLILEGTTGLDCVSMGTLDEIQTLLTDSKNS